MKIYVGNLNYDVNDQHIRKAFSAFGKIEDAYINRDKITNRSKGHGFLEMPDVEEARKAIEGMNGKDLNGKPLKVHEAKPTPEKGFHGNQRKGFTGGQGGSQVNSPIGGAPTAKRSSGRGK